MISENNTANFDNYAVEYSSFLTFGNGFSRRARGSDQLWTLALYFGLQD